MKNNKSVGYAFVTMAGIFFLSGIVVVSRR